MISQNRVTKPVQKGEDKMYNTNYGNITQQELQELGHIPAPKRLLQNKERKNNMTLEQKLSNIRKITAIQQTQYRLRLQNRQHTTEYQELEKEITRLEKEIGE